MTDSDEKLEKKEYREESHLEISLEAPPQSALGESTVGLGFMSSDEIMNALAKAQVTEKFFDLLVKPTSFKEFLDGLMLPLVQALKCEAASLLEWDKRNKLYFFRSVVGPASEKVAQFQIPEGKGIVGRIGQTRKAEIVHRASDEAQPTGHLSQIGASIGFTSNEILAVPVLIRGELYGVVEVINRTDGQVFRDEHLKLLCEFCAIMAKALEVRFMLGRKAA